ncbi:FAD-binding protein [Corynebacterium sp. sy017]|nr:FAD-binding protein [Corynebacterium sp. sy017]TSD91854.1 FAD-binding protein [Corynebacterium sp. SY003]
MMTLFLVVVFFHASIIDTCLFCRQVSIFLCRVSPGIYSETKKEGKNMHLYNPANNYHKAQVISPCTKKELQQALKKYKKIPVCNTGHGFHPDAAHAPHVLDLSHLRSHTWQENLVKVSAATRWKDIASSIPAGRRCVTGSFSGVGICGFLSGAGIGPDVRLVGPATNYVQELELVDRTGQCLSCSPTHNVELWEQALTTKATHTVIAQAVIATIPDETFIAIKCPVHTPDLVQWIMRWAQLCPQFPEIGSSIQIMFMQKESTVSLRIVARKQSRVRVVEFLTTLGVHAEITTLAGSELAQLHQESEHSPASFMDGLGITNTVNEEQLGAAVAQLCHIGERSPFFGFELRHCELDPALLDTSLPSQVWAGIKFVLQHGSLAHIAHDVNHEITELLGKENTRLLPNFSRLYATAC